MSRLKKIGWKAIKIKLWFLFLLFAIVLGWLLCALTFPKFKVNSDWKQAPAGVEIFAKSNGVHTDILVPVKNNCCHWDSLFAPSTFKEADSACAYIAFGWGDKGFYLYTPTWADLKFSTAFKAAFWLGESAMHVTYYQNAPLETGRCKKMIVTEEQYKKLIAYIKNSFDTEKGKIIYINHPGYGSNDNFYEAKGKYSLLKTCNVWAGDALKNCGVKIGIWTPTDKAIVEEIE